MPRNKIPHRYFYGKDSLIEFAQNPLFLPVAQLGIALYIVNAGVGDALAMIGDSRLGLQHDLRHFRIDQKKASEDTEQRLCDKMQAMEARINTSIQDFRFEISKSFQQAREDTRKDRKDLQEANYAAHKAPKDDIERLFRVAGKDPGDVTARMISRRQEGQGHLHMPLMPPSSIHCKKCRVAIARRVD
ncbi:MAG: hypothetical protein Q9204_006109 [Flavoplaca sp. TL-2023a]